MSGFKRSSVGITRKLRRKRGPEGIEGGGARDLRRPRRPVNATRGAAQAALEAARLKHEVVTFSEAGHAFFNDTGTRFNPAAAAEAYHRLEWLDRFLGR